MQTRRVITAALVAAGLVVGSAGTVSADQIVIELPQQVIFGGPPGATFLLAEETVPVEQQGLVCSGDLVAQNNFSVHPGTNIRVTSASEVLLVDVEATPDKVTPLTTPLALGSQIRIELIMGPDEVFSGAFRLELQCEPAEQQPPPTTEPPTTEPPTTGPPTTGPDDGTVDAGAPGGGQPPAVGANPGAAGPAGQQLPATGPREAAMVAAFGAVLLGMGIVLNALASTGSALSRSRSQM
jgi:hypothetical protein